jgi:hypothetical protein
MNRFGARQAVPARRGASSEDGRAWNPSPATPDAAGNRYRCQVPSPPGWTLGEFVTLRDRVFADRFQRVAARRVQEAALFASKPWEQR